MKRIVLTFIALVFSILTKAEVVEITPGCKILHVSELNYPTSTTLAELLDLFPELLSREGDSRLDNYDIQVGGVSSGSSREAVLLQLQVSDIKDISVSQSPDLTRQQNGQGGVINIVLKDVEEGVSGGIALKAGSLAEVTPVFKLNCRKGDFLLRSSLMLDYTHPLHDYSLTIREYEDLSPISSKDSCRRDEGYEHAKLTLSWIPDTVNTFNAWIWQSYDGEHLDTRSLTETPMRFRSISDNRTGNLSLTAGASYFRKISSGGISTRLEYSLSPSSSLYSSKVLPGVSVMDCSGSHRSSALGGFTSFQTTLLPATPRSSLEMTVGLNYKYTGTSSSHTEFVSSLSDEALYTQVRTMYLSPYLEMYGRMGSAYIKGGARFQSLSTSITSSGAGDYDTVEGDFTAFLNFGWKISTRHNLSLILDRSISRPSAAQLYPYRIYDPGNRSYTEGDKALKPVSLHNAIMTYCYDDSNHWMVSSSIQYINAQDILSSYYSNGCMYWKNDGTADIVAANATMFWRCGVLNLSVNGNVFSNWTTLMGSHGEYFYFNLAVSPLLCFKHGFRITPKLVYNSHIYAQNRRLGDYIFAKIGASKAWGRFTLSADIDDIFHKYVTDTASGTGFIETRTYNLHNPNFSISAHLSF